MHRFEPVISFLNWKHSIPDENVDTCIFHYVMNNEIMEYIFSAMGSHYPLGNWGERETVLLRQFLSKIIRFPGKESYDRLVELFRCLLVKCWTHHFPENPWWNSNGNEVYVCPSFFSRVIHPPHSDDKTRDGTVRWIIALHDSPLQCLKQIPLALLLEWQRLWCYSNLCIMQHDMLSTLHPSKLFSEQANYGAVTSIFLFAQNVFETSRSTRHIF